MSVADSIARVQSIHARIASLAAVSTSGPAAAAAATVGTESTFASALSEKLDADAGGEAHGASCCCCRGSAGEGGAAQVHGADGAIARGVGAPLAGGPARLGPPSPFDEQIVQAAREANVPPALLKAMCRSESNFNPRAQSHAGAQGLMQLMPGTARGLGVTDAFDPVQSLRGGARYLRQQLDRFGGDVSKAVAAYNAGPGAVQRFGGVPPYRETQTYVQRVLGYVAEYGGLTGSPTAVPRSAALPTSALRVARGPLL
jgi:hypothetical protein